MLSIQIKIKNIEKETAEKVVALVMRKLEQEGMKDQVQDVNIIQHRK